MIMKKICDVCLNEFETKKNAQKTCSQECKEKKIEKKYIKKISNKDLKCTNCEKDFVGNLNNKFCSKECRGEYRSKNLKSVTVNCYECGKQIKSKVKKKVNLCSEECKKKHAKKRIGKESHCKQCGIKFYSKYKTQKYCSRECTCKSRIVIKNEICAGCNKEFKPRRSEYNKYCSIECYFEVNKVETVTFKCKDCGKEEVRNKRDLNKRCNYCFQEKARINLEIKHEKQRLKAKKRSDLEKAKKERELALNKTCKQCGESFKGKHLRATFCSDDCRKTYWNSKNDLRIEKMKLNGEIDKSITLGKLMKRDKEVCYICKGVCDKSDFKRTRKGSFVAGPTYPSIDHVVAIDNGGTHTWDNVKLAHFYCNSLKSNKDYIENNRAQIFIERYLKYKYKVNKELRG